MKRLLNLAGSRLVPALLTASGVILLTAGLLSYADATQPGLTADQPQVIEAPLSTSSPSPAGTPASVAPSAPPTDDPGQSPTDSPAPGARAFATRVVVPALRIDLPVVKGPAGYPFCNVAMYIRELAQPGEGGATYLYAHARDGMFGPIYHLAIETGSARKLLGMIVQVYTSDDKLYLYEVDKVLLHQLNLDNPLKATGEQLWLQTSEGPKGTPGKTQVRARLLSVGAADPNDAHPKPKPVVCG